MPMSSFCLLSLRLLEYQSQVYQDKASQTNQFGFSVASVSPGCGIGGDSRKQERCGPGTVAGRLLHLDVHCFEFTSISAQSLLWSAPEITCLTESWSTRKYRNYECMNCAVFYSIQFLIFHYTGCSSSPPYPIQGRTVSWRKLELT